MKRFIKYTLAVTLAAGATASASHHHQHRHVRKDGTNVEKRSPDVVIQYVPGPTATQFELGGKVIDAKEAEAGLRAGNYVIVGETTPSYVPPPPPAPTTSTTSQDMKAQFIESKTSSAPPPTTTTTSATPSPSPKPSQQAAQPKGSVAGGGLTSPFPDGVMPCDSFPSGYGAVPLDYLGFGGWAGLQRTPDYTTSDVSISNIITGISGETCGSKGPGFCSYACPVGYQKSQFPSAQGSAKQSVGGVHCNKDGFLELTRKESKVLCEPCVGGVTIQNDLSDVVSTCKTEYPGTESMVIPAVANPGGSVPLCNPDQSYYSWVGLPTSAQYYVNKRGLSPEVACVWECENDPKDCGNWAAINIGVGRASDGLTYISIFPNAPTSTAKLDFNIEITGDVNSKCSLINGHWGGGNGNGCTTAMRAGGQAVIRYFD